MSYWLETGQHTNHCQQLNFFQSSHWRVWLMWKYLYHIDDFVNFYNVEWHWDRKIILEQTNWMTKYNFLIRKFKETYFFSILIIWKTHLRETGQKIRIKLEINNKKRENSNTYRQFSLIQLSQYGIFFINKNSSI